MSTRDLRVPLSAANKHNTSVSSLEVDSVLLSFDHGARRRRSSHHGSGHAASGGLSVFEVCTMQMAIILGLGVLGLSFAFATMGWVVGVLLISLAAVGAIYSGIFISDLVQHLTRQAHADGVTPIPRRYSDLGFAAFGSKGATAVRCVQYTFLGGALVAVQYTAATALVQVVGGGMCVAMANGVVAVTVLPIMQVQHLSDVSWTAVLGVCMIIAPVVLYLIVVVQHAPLSCTPGSCVTSVMLPPTLTFDSIANGVTTVVFAYQGQTIFPELIAQMRTPSKFPTAVVAATAFMTFVYLVVGSIGYSMLGGSATYLVDYVDNLDGADTTYVTAANAMLIVNVLMGYTINGNVMNHAVHDMLFAARVPPSAPRDFYTEAPGLSPQGKGSIQQAAPTHGHIPQLRAARWQWLVTTILTVSASVALSLVTPSLGNLLSLLGATCGYTLTFLFPAVFSVKLLGPSRLPVNPHGGVVALTLVAIAVGTYATGSTVVESIQKAGVTGFSGC